MEKVIPLNKLDDPPGSVSEGGGLNRPLSLTENQAMALSTSTSKGMTESNNMSPSGTGSPQSGDKDEYGMRQKSFQNSKKKVREVSVGSNHLLSLEKKQLICNITYICCLAVTDSDRKSAELWVAYGRFESNSRDRR